MFFYITTEWWYRAVCRKKILRDFHMGHPGKNRAKSLMRCYVYWPNMDKDIADMADSCKGCTLAAKAPAIPCKPWPKTVQPWQRIHVDFAGPLGDQYYHIVVDGHTKWSQVFSSRSPITNYSIGFLHELFARFGVVDCVVTDNATQFTSNEFKQFCDTYQVKHNTIQGQTDRRRGLWIPWRGLWKRHKALRQIGRCNRITPNPNTPMGRSPAETMFARKIRSVFDKLIPRQARFKKTLTLPKKRYACSEKVLLKIYKNDMTFWEMSTVKQSGRTSLYYPRPQEHT